MSAALLDIANEGEAIPDLGERPWDGPDMRTAMPVDHMLTWLDAAALGTLSSYVQTWRGFARSIGVSVGLMHKSGEAAELVYGCPVDAQRRHRLRWMYFLNEDLLSREGARDALAQAINAKPEPEA